MLADALVVSAELPAGEVLQLGLGLRGGTGGNSTLAGHALFGDKLLDA